MHALPFHGVRPRGQYGFCMVRILLLRKNFLKFSRASQNALVYSVFIPNSVVVDHLDLHLFTTPLKQERNTILRLFKEETVALKRQNQRLESNLRKSKEEKRDVEVWLRSKLELLKRKRSDLNKK